MLIFTFSNKPGIFEATPGSRLSQSNLVFIPYCSSDAHLSTGQTFDFDFGPDQGGVRTIHFNGQILAQSIVQVSDISSKRLKKKV